MGTTWSAPRSRRAETLRSAVLVRGGRRLRPGLPRRSWLAHEGPGLGGQRGGQKGPEIREPRYIEGSTAGHGRARAAVCVCLSQADSSKLLLESICGDGLVVGSEGCDDGNLDTFAQSALQPSYRATEKGGDAALSIRRMLGTDAVPRARSRRPQERTDPKLATQSKMVRFRQRSPASLALLKMP